MKDIDQLDKPELRAHLKPMPDTPENLRQKISWSKEAKPKVEIRNVKVKKPRKKKKKKTRKPKKDETRYAYIIHGCTKCKKQEVIKIPEKAVVELAKQIRVGFTPKIPDGMSVCTVKMDRGESNEENRSERV
jgi:hypothetical protein